jgi:phenylalanyl-tRNA synthetase beta chain
VSSGEIERCVRQEACDVLVDLTLFDVYEGENLGADKKSIALSLTLQHPSRTLSDEETSEIITNCINALAAKFDAELRD